jgi:hypothetical protein
MTVQTKATLKGYFNTGDSPSEANFADLIDSEERKVSFNVMDYGAVGDGIHDDTAALEAAAADIPSIGGTLFFPPNKIFKIAHGFHIWQDNVTVMGYGATLYTDDVSDDFNPVTHLWASPYGGGLIRVFNTGVRAVVAGIPTESGLQVHNFRCFGMTFLGIWGIGDAWDERYNGAIGLMGVVGGCVKDCVFRSGRVEQIYSDRLLKDFEISSNLFDNLGHDGISIIVPTCVNIHNNIFKDVWQPCECGGYYLDIHDNQIQNTSVLAGNTPIWVDNEVHQLVKTRIYNNHISGLYTADGILIMDRVGNPSLFANIAIKDNKIGDGWDGGSGHYMIQCYMGPGNYEISGNQLDDAGASSNFEGFIGLVVSDNGGTYAIHNNKMVVSTNYPLIGITVPDGCTAGVTITNNETITTTGSYRTAYNDSPLVYKGWIKVGVADMTKQVLLDNLFNREILYYDASANTIINIGSDSMYMTSQTKNIAQIIASRPFGIRNTGAGLTLKQSGNLYTITGADVTLGNQVVCFLAPINQAGNIMRQMTAVT